jgi:hypothetical protein
MITVFYTVCRILYGMANHKLTIMVNDNIKGILELVKDETGMSATEQIRKGVQFLNYLLELQKEGQEFRVYEKDGGYRQVTVYF